MTRCLTLMAVASLVMLVVDILTTALLGGAPNTYSEYYYNAAGAFIGALGYRWIWG